MSTTEAKATVAHFDWRTVMNASADFPEKNIAVLDRYFSQFVALEIKTAGGEDKPEIQEQKCVGCGGVLTGFKALIGGGGFQWGFVHGHGHCAGCKWPAIAHHFIKDDAGEDVVALHNFILQVHPDFVGRRTEAA